MRLTPTEHEEQATFVDWLRWNKIPCFSVPNGAVLGGKNRFAILNKLKAEGFENGIPDLFLPSLHLFIEMKSEKGKVSPDQERWHKILQTAGFIVEICRSSDEAIKITRGLLHLDKLHRE